MCDIDIHNCKIFQIRPYFDFSVCQKPTYVEAREKITLKDWTGSESILIHQMKSKNEWATGFSKDFGSVIRKKYKNFVII